MGIIDFRAIIPISKALNAARTPPPGMESVAGYGERYHMPPSESLVMTPDELVEKLDSRGVDHMVLRGSGVTNEELADYVSKYPGRLSGIASVSPREGLRGALQSIRRSHSLGFRIVGIRPFLDQLTSCDRLYYPIYAVCAELGMAVATHTSFHYGQGLKLDHSRPLYLDEVANDFPELRIIANHGGWPWVAEMVAVAWKNENIYIELSAQPARHMSKEGSGWESIFNYGSGPLRSRLLWGSSSPYLDFEKHLGETRRLPFRNDTVDRMLTDNPRQLLGSLGVDIVAHGTRSS